MSLTDQIVDLAHLPANQIPEGARAKAQLSLLDWMVCGWAGRDEPLSGKLRDLAALEGGRPVAHVFGGAPGAMQVPARMAALVNGAVSHALDYDDTHFAHVGHLSVGIYPAALAVAEELDASQAQLVEAFVIGAEAAIRIGVALGAAHYNRGFHQTATAGAFGATVAAARLYGLDADQTRAAIGLCATRASGLRSQFGTMGKPYNAGIAASTGVECAQLARLGMTSALDGLTGPQGFLDTHSDATHVGDAFDLPPAQGFLFDDNKYKFHACCHGTHAMIEGLLAVRPAGLTLDDVAGVTLLTSPRWLSVCDKKAPTTGLEVKFSYAWLAGMALRGDETGDDRAYSDALAQDPALADFASRVEVTGDAGVTDLQARGQITLRDGEVLDYAHDLAAPLPGKLLRDKLLRKAQAAIGPMGPAFADHLASPGGTSARAIGALIAEGA
ncbi:2-methylcitrate dehydratase PrpD [Pseudooceanicola nitratireducens]|jgi:2-methylcitrate dehydratase PrpD|uniref:2-methylcitrate dehydratase PrpD n=1 Tax=Pseudooceanicola nitratireducens TaxID=517719 RepID=A0A1I1J2G9_9RHOB|nr:MmgE/PrpD family protein [Pseudooceanicola nitratireducens]SEJ28859.1 2-methylcitrate dehydratase PrpD [Pseudooceanicola nitratireducens]SFC42799.1 2-methylcitrate dehydratase PrpD [Pseudooceanicola nitratireducens]